MYITTNRPTLQGIGEKKEKVRKINTSASCIFFSSLLGTNNRDFGLVGKVNISLTGT